MQTEWQQALAASHGQALHRSRTLIDAQEGARIRVDGRWYLNFSSNDVLGLSQHPQVKAMAQAALDQWGLGAGASPLVTGYRAPHAALEDALAEALGFKRALYVANGYVANLSVAKALMGKGQCVWMDREVHASLLDGVMSSGATWQRYRRSQSERWRALLQPGDWLVTDSVFSMSGDVAPMSALHAITQSSGAHLVIDDAHGLGVLGEDGLGVMSGGSLQPHDVTALVCPLGKAIGAYGAVILGSALVIDTLIQRARGLIYSTAPPPVLASAALMAFQLMQRESCHRAKLHANRCYLNEAIQIDDLPMQPRDAAIYFLPLGSAERALQAQAQARSQGLWCVAMRPPTVPVAGLRLVLSALHTQADLDQLIHFIKVTAHAASPYSS